MSSEQLRRDNKTDEREVHIEKDKVPKVTSHFESITVKDKGGVHETHHVIETVATSASAVGTQTQTQSQSQSQKDKMQGATLQSKEHKGVGEAQKTQGATLQSKEHESKGPSLEDISKYRGTAQQNSMDAIRAAEERYQKAKEISGSGTQAQNVSKSSSQQNKGGTTQTASQQASRAKDQTGKTQQSRQPTKVYSGQEGRPTGATAGEKSTAETAVDMTKKAGRYIGDTAVAAADIAMETRKTREEYAGKLAGVAKDSAKIAGRGATDLAGSTAKGVSHTMETVNAGVAGLVENTAETAVDAGKKGAVAAKDIALEAGKTTAVYAGKAAGVAKDTAVVAGQRTAEFAGDAAMGVTGGMETVNAGVAGLIDKTAETIVDVSKKGASNIRGTAVAAKDGALQTGKASVGYGEKAAGVVKDTTIASGQRAAELASNTAMGVTDGMGTMNAGVASVIDKTADTIVDVSKKGASNVRDTAVAAKDGAVGTGKAAVGYGGKAAGAVKDTTVVAGQRTAEMAKGTAMGVTQGMETVNAGVAGVVENTAETAVDATMKGAAAAKDFAVDTGKATVGYAGKAAGVVKDTAVGAGRMAAQIAGGAAMGITEGFGTVNAGVAGVIDNTAETVLETGRTAGSYVGKAAGAAKNTAVVAGQSAAEVARGTASGVAQTMENATVGVEDTAETAMDVSKKGASYAGRTAVTARDVTVEAGKTTAGYVGNVAGTVKDTTAVAGWRAVELASDAALGVTQTMAGVTAGAAGLAKDAVVATKDVVAQVGVKTKDTLVSTEENVKDYATMKKEEKIRELEAKNAKGEEESGYVESDFKYKVQTSGGYKTSFEQQETHGSVEGDFGQQGDGGGAASGGLMQAIGETLVEIGQNTTEMFGGQRAYEGEQQQMGQERETFKGGRQ